MKKRLCFVLVILIVASMVLSACGEDEEEAPKELTMVLQEKFETLDPLAHNGLTNHMLDRNVFGSLVDRDADGNIVPELATEWKAIDPTTWEFKLREDVKFHNGEEWDAETAKLAIDRLASSEQFGFGLQPAYWRNIDHAEVVDDLTIRIITKAPTGALLNNLVLGHVLPKSILEKYATEQFFSIDEAIGTGPYKLIDWVAGVSAEIEANPDYWGGKPDVDRVKFLTITDAATRLAALQSGDADVVWDLQPPEAVEELRANPDIVIYSIPTMRNEWMPFGPRAPFNVHQPQEETGRLMREAAQRAVDFDTICNTLLVGIGLCGHFNIPPSIFGGDADLDPSVNSYDPERSREILAELGYAEGDGPEIRFISVGTPQPVLEAIAAQLEAVGFKVNLEIFGDITAWFEVRTAGEYDINSFGFTALTGDADSLLPAEYYTGISRNKYTNPEVDQYIDQAAAETDPQKRLELYQKANELIWADRVDLYNYQQILVVGARDYVEGLVVQPNNMLNIADMSIKE